MRLPFPLHRRRRGSRALVLGATLAFALRAARGADEAPWREWAVALEDQRFFDQAHRVLLEGRRAVRRPTALAAELADLAQRAGDWGEAAAEWGRVVTESPAQLPNAMTQLDDAPAGSEERGKGIRALAPAPAMAEGPGGDPARRLAALLLLGWGQPARAWTLFEGTLGPPSDQAATALRQLADRAAAFQGAEAKRVRGLALARYAELVPPQLAGRGGAAAGRGVPRARGPPRARGGGGGRPGGAAPPPRPPARGRGGGL